MKKYKDLAAVHAGPACIEVFGEIPFVPESRDAACALTEEQQKLRVRMDSESGQITNRYIIGERAEFLPSSPIRFRRSGNSNPEIFRETVKINTLDYKKYRQIQQILIDLLDQGTEVHVGGRNGNQTDLTIRLQPPGESGPGDKF